MIIVPGGSIDLDGTGADNYVATFTGPTTIGGEANLTFDGSTLTVTGAVNVTLTDDDADSLTFANSASNYYNIDTRNTVVGISAHQFDSEDPVMASASNAVSNLALFKQHQVNWSGTTQVTSLQAVVNIDDVILYNDEAMTLDKATGLVIQPPRRGHANLTLSETSGIRITDASTAVGAPAIQSGIHIENMAAGTLDYGLYIADADTYSIFVDDGVSRFDGGAVIGYSGTTGDFHANADNLIVGTGTGHNGMSIYAANDSRSAIFFADGTSGAAEYAGYISYNHDGNQMNFGTAGQDSMYLKGGATPQLWLTTSTTQVDAAMVLDGNAIDYYIGLDDGGDALFIGSGSTVGSNGAIIIDKKGGVSSDALHVGMNATPNINDLVTIGGAFAGYSNTFGLRVEPTLTAKAGNNAAIISVAGTLVEAGSGTHNLLFGTSFSAPTVTGGSAAVANTATVYVSGAMSPTVTGANYALWVAGGVSRFDGIVETFGSRLRISDGGQLQIQNGDEDYLWANYVDGSDNLVWQNNAGTDKLSMSSAGNVQFANWVSGSTANGYLRFYGDSGASIYSQFTDTGLFLINDTANANQDIGLTINSGTSTKWAFTLKGSNVDTNTGGAIPAATNVDDKDYFAISKLNGTEGGAQINVMNDNHANTRAFVIGVSGGQAEDDQTNSSGLGLMDIYVTQHNGSGSAGTVTDGGNVLSVRCNSGGSALTRFIVTEDGELFATNSTVAALSDTYDDAQLVRALDHAKDANGAKGIVKDKWDSFVKYNEQDLVDIGVLGETVDKGGMLSVTALQRLHNGAIWQGYTRQMEQQERIKELETRLLSLEGGV